MALDFKELDITELLSKINAFWSSNLFQDKNITDQLWRGYMYVMENFYTQLYQLARARGISTFPDKWYSHYEKFILDQSTEVPAWNPNYPYAFKLPKNVKSVYVLRESPREITILPKGTIIDDASQQVILPSGTPRLPGDTIYNSGDYKSYSVTCPTCGGYGVYLGDPCPTCGGSGIVSGVYTETGLPVDTVKYLKRADDVYDFDESAGPQGDFICGTGIYSQCPDDTDAEQYYIAFAVKPYPVLYSQYVVRNTELIYEMFGSLISFYKKDSQEYLRQVQALWYAFWNGSTLDNIQSGLSVLADLPVVTNPGYVTSIREQLSDTITKLKVTPAFFTDPVIILPTPPILDPEDPTKYQLELTDDNLTTYLFTQGLDFEVVIEYESSFTGGIPSLTPVPKVVIDLSRPVSALIQNDDILTATYKAGDGDYIIHIPSVDYFIPNNLVPSVYENQYVEAYTPLTNDVGVYDYVNFPNWWESYFGGTNIFDPALNMRRLQFDSPFPFDQIDGHLDNSADGALARATIWPYFTFLVTLTYAAMPTTQEGLRMYKAFLDLIKPSYSTYIIVGEWEFTDEANVRDIGFDGSITYYVPFEHGDRFIHHDDWHYPNLDSGERTFDSWCGPERLLLTNITPEFTLYDRTSPSAMFDETAGRIFDDGNTFDNSDDIEHLDLSH